MSGPEDNKKPATPVTPEEAQKARDTKVVADFITSITSTGGQLDPEKLNKIEVDLNVRKAVFSRTPHDHTSMTLEDFNKATYSFESQSKAHAYALLSEHAIPVDPKEHRSPNNIIIVPSIPLEQHNDALIKEAITKIRYSGMVNVNENGVFQPTEGITAANVNDILHGKVVRPNGTRDQNMTAALLETISDGHGHIDRQKMQAAEQEIALRAQRVPQAQTMMQAQHFSDTTRLRPEVVETLSIQAVPIDKQKGTDVHQDPNYVAVKHALTQPTIAQGPGERIPLVDVRGQMLQDSILQKAINAIKGAGIKDDAEIPIEKANQLAHGDLKHHFRNTGVTTDGQEVASTQTNSGVTNVKTKSQDQPVQNR